MESQNQAENNSVLITGANRGIGLSFCQHYKALGYIVYGVCRKSSVYEVLVGWCHRRQQSNPLICGGNSE